MNEHTRIKGNRGEDEARNYLISKGYKILGMNYYAGKFGEIDLITRDGEYLVFVEVRSRETFSGGLPEETISRSKFSKLVRSIQHYLKKTQQNEVNYRIDLIAISGNGENRIRHYPNISMEF